MVNLGLMKYFHLLPWEFWPGLSLLSIFSLAFLLCIVSCSHCLTCPFTWIFSWLFNQYHYPKSECYYQYGGQTVPHAKSHEYGELQCSSWGLKEKIKTFHTPDFLTCALHPVCMCSHSKATDHLTARRHEQSKHLCPTPPTPPVLSPHPKKKQRTHLFAVLVWTIMSIAEILYLLSPGASCAFAEI